MEWIGFIAFLCVIFVAVIIFLVRDSDKKVNYYKNKLAEELEKKHEIASTIEEADAFLNSTKKEADDILTSAQSKVTNLEQKREQLNQELDDLNNKIKLASSELVVLETTVFEKENLTSEEYKDKLAMLTLEYKEFVKSGDAVIVTGSEYGTKKRLNDNVKQIIRCFNSEASAIVGSVTAVNIEKMRTALLKAFETINSLFSTDGVSLNKQLFEMKLKELNLVYSYQQKKAQEQEEQKAIRAQMIEEEKVRREIEREKAKIEKEESQFKNEINKLMQYLAKSSVIEKQLYVDKINELNEKLKLLEKDKENVLEREQNTRAGYVYIISNIGSFGEDVYKIGMTRRLEPMDRVKELGDASVPFEFDVHAMIFSEDAPALETILHNTFKERQVNLVNPRKEFYNVPLSDIEKVVKEKYNATVTFTQAAEAAQYRESVRLRERLAVNV